MFKKVLNKLESKKLSSTTTDRQFINDQIMNTEEH